jgi:hypothetical protein
MITKTRLRRPARPVLAGLLLALALPATAFADPPAISNTRATDVGQNGATARAAVDPNSNNTSAFFQYGTSKLYGSTTPAVSVGSGSKKVPVAATIGGLTSFTTYHFRAVAQYGPGNKLVFGADHTFKTKKQPLGMSLIASPAFVHSGGSSTLSGTVSGTDYKGQQVQLQSAPFPYTTYTNTGNAQVVGDSGTFSFPILDVFKNTAFKAFLTEKPDVVSPVVGVAVRLRVRLKIAKKATKGQRHLFRGRISPADPTSRVQIQRRFHGTWVTVARTQIHDSGAGSSFFRKRVRIRHSGRYRALIVPSGDYVQSLSRTHRVRVRH